MPDPERYREALLVLRPAWVDALTHAENRDAQTGRAGRLLQQPHPSAAEDRLEEQARDRLEDPIVGYERDRQSDSHRGDPAVGVVVPLTERMPDALAVSPEPRIDLDELRPGPHDLGLTDARLEPARAVLAPAPTYGAVTQLGDGLERDECWPTGDEWLVQRGEG